MIELKNVTFKYPENETPALCDVSLCVNPGEVLCVLGANGSGKSTLAKLFNGILIPTLGDVVVDGVNTRCSEQSLQVRQLVGMVFQNPDNQIVGTVVEEDVAFALENLGVPEQEMRRRVDEAMAQTDISRFATTAPHKLSGGQKQRVAIAGVLAMRPRYLVLDEATAMLDPAGRISVLKTVSELRRDKKIAVVHITHYMEEALTADRVIVLSKGEVALQGTPQEVFVDTQRLRELRLTPPTARLLCEYLAKSGINLPPNTLTNEETVRALLPLLKSV